MAHEANIQIVKSTPMTGCCRTRRPNPSGERPEGLLAQRPLLTLRLAGCHGEAELFDEGPLFSNENSATCLNESILVRKEG
jgi:hypothetical protein